MPDDFDAPPAVKSPAPVDATSRERRFEFRQGNSSKFWGILVEGRSHTVRYGRIGTRGQSQTKEFENESTARADAERLVGEKLRKGYQEQETLPPDE
jgi:predicted DNA-binding WGR domain protein